MHAQHLTARFFDLSSVIHSIYTMSFPRTSSEPPQFERARGSADAPQQASSVDDRPPRCLKRKSLFAEYVGACDRTKMACIGSALEELPAATIQPAVLSDAGDDDMAASFDVALFFSHRVYEAVAVLRWSRGRTRRLSATLVVSATMIAVTSPPINHSFPRGLTYNSYYSPFTGIAFYGCGR